MQRGVLSLFGDNKAAAESALKKKQNEKFEKAMSNWTAEKRLDKIQRLSGDHKERVYDFIAHQRAKSADPDEQQAYAFWDAFLKTQSADSKVDEDFKRDFIGWLQGLGREEHHQKTAWGRSPAMLDLPDVRAWLETFIDEKMQVQQSIFKLIFRGPQNLNEAYLYFKYVVNDFVGEDSLIFEDFRDFMGGDFDFSETTGQAKHGNQRGVRGVIGGGLKSSKKTRQAPDDQDNYNDIYIRAGRKSSYRHGIGRKRDPHDRDGENFSYEGAMFDDSEEDGPESDVTVSSESDSSSDDDAPGPEPRPSKKRPKDEDDVSALSKVMEPLTIKLSQLVDALNNFNPDPLAELAEEDFERANATKTETELKKDEEGGNDEAEVEEEETTEESTEELGENEKEEEELTEYESLEEQTYMQRIGSFLESFNPAMAKAQEDNEKFKKERERQEKERKEREEHEKLLQTPEGQDFLTNVYRPYAHLNHLAYQGTFRYRYATPEQQKRYDDVQKRFQLEASNAKMALHDKHLEQFQKFIKPWNKKQLLEENANPGKDFPEHYTPEMRKIISERAQIHDEIMARQKEEQEKERIAEEERKEKEKRERAEWEGREAIIRQQEANERRLKEEAERKAEAEKRAKEQKKLEELTEKLEKAKAELAKKQQQRAQEIEKLKQQAEEERRRIEIEGESEREREHQAFMKKHLEELEQQKEDEQAQKDLEQFHKRLQKQIAETSAERERRMEEAERQPRPAAAKKAGQKKRFTKNDMEAIEQAVEKEFVTLAELKEVSLLNRQIKREEAIQRVTQEILNQARAAGKEITWEQAWKIAKERWDEEMRKYQERHGL